jgi:hypothetical protein
MPGVCVEERVGVEPGIRVVVVWLGVEAGMEVPGLQAERATNASRTGIRERCGRMGI